MFNKLLILILITIYVIFEFKTKYKILNPVKTLKTNKGNLLICSHSYEHKDIFIMLNEVKKMNIKFNILFANKIWNHLLEPLRPNNVEFMYVKNNTVNKISSKLLLGNNIIIFLYLLKKPPSGIYNILKNTNVNTHLVKIKSNNKPINHLNSNIPNIIINNMFACFDISYKKIRYNIGNNSSLFMKTLTNKLYN